MPDKLQIFKTHSSNIYWVPSKFQVLFQFGDKAVNKTENIPVLMGNKMGTYDKK